MDFNVDKLLKKVGVRRLSEADKLKEMPFGKAPRATKALYMERFEEARGFQYPPVDALEEATGYRIDRAALEDLALHTQIVLKKNPLNFSHGRIIYSRLRERLDQLDPKTPVTILETGTARGFSALCMAMALRDHQRVGRIFTVDILPHRKPIYWNCIDDHERAKSRKELLEPWRELCESIVFLNADSNDALKMLDLDRIHFAFLDGAHTEEDVLAEHAYVSQRQIEGDVILYDDVSDQFPGIQAAVAQIQASPRYNVALTQVSDIYTVALATCVG